MPIIQIADKYSWYSKMDIDDELLKDDLLGEEDSLELLPGTQLDFQPSFDSTSQIPPSGITISTFYWYFSYLCQS